MCWVIKLIHKFGAFFRIPHPHASFRPSKTEADVGSSGSEVT